MNTHRTLPVIVPRRESVRKVTNMPSLASIPTPEEDDVANTIRISVERAMSGAHVIAPWAGSTLRYADDLVAGFGDIAPDTGRGANYVAP